MIAEYYLSPVRNDDKATLGANYWGTRDYQQIPYKKGFVYALYIDHLVRSSSAGKHSLDDVMFALREEKLSKKRLTDTTFTELVKTFSGQDISGLQENYINKGETIPVPAGSIGRTEIKTDPLGRFDLGFDQQASRETKTVTGVKPDSEAWKAGLRDGQIIKGFSIYYDDLSHPAEITVEENGVPKTISYNPMSSERIDVPQFFLKND
jgi:predicted metalloprotease with PDZ domain